jgi:hypothetical protein
MNYEEFKEKLVECGFEVDCYHLPFMRVDYPQLMVGWVANPQGIQLQVKYTPKDQFEVLRVEYRAYYEATINQIEFTISQHLGLK